MRKGQKTQKKLEFRLKNNENRQKEGLKSCFWALIGTKRDFFESSGGTSGFGLQIAIGTIPTRSGRLASMRKEQLEEAKRSMVQGKAGCS